MHKGCTCSVEDIVPRVPRHGAREVLGRQRNATDTDVAKTGTQTRVSRRPHHGKAKTGQPMQKSLCHSTNLVILGSRDRYGRRISMHVSGGSNAPLRGCRLPTGSTCNRSHLNGYPPSDVGLSIQESESRNLWESKPASERAEGRRQFASKYMKAPNRTVLIQAQKNEQTSRRSCVTKVNSYRPEQVVL